MAKKEEAVRNFSGSDAVMVQNSRVMHGIFITDKARFISFDKDFSDPFGDNWIQAAEIAINVTQDADTLVDLTAYSQMVENKMEECRRFFMEMKYFIEKAFPNNKENWEPFGYSEYDSVRKSETKMIKFLGVLYKTTLKYKTQLLNAGFPEEKVERIQELQNELEEADYNQEIDKKGRPLLTQDRINILNECYGYMQKVSKAAKIIFADNYAKFNQYLLPSESSEKKEKETVPQPEPNQG